MPKESAEQQAARRSIAIRLLTFAVSGAGYVAAATVFVLMVHIIVDVALRYLANAPLPATIEIVSFWWMVLVTFPALALTQRRREHVDVTLLTDLMPRTHRRYAIMGARLATIVVISMLGWFGWLYALEQMARGEIAMGSIAVPIWPMRFAVPIGMLLFALQLTADLVLDLWSERGSPDER